MKEEERQSRQDWAVWRSEGCRGLQRRWWRLVAWWWGDKHISLWPALIVVAFVAFAILVARGL